jgi:hypothetical protein
LLSRADGTVHDAKRIDYIREHVASMSQAIDEGVDLIGYTYWSFVDILSSSDGMGKRYGLVYVDREDFEGSVTVGDLKKHGDTGIGTFDGLNGELVMLDGEVWQAAGDGSVNLMEDAATIPFGNVTFLDSDETLDVSGVESFEALLKQLDGRVAELGTNNCVSHHVFARSKSHTHSATCSILMSRSSPPDAWQSHDYSSKTTRSGATTDDEPRYRNNGAGNRNARAPPPCKTCPNAAKAKRPDTSKNLPETGFDAHPTHFELV